MQMNVFHLSSGSGKSGRLKPVEHLNPCASILLILVIALLPYPAFGGAGIVNGDFSVSESSPDFGWSTSGNVLICDGKAVLGEGDEYLTSLWQSFELPAETIALKFTLTVLNLQPNSVGETPDAFEVALLNAATGNPIGYTITSMPAGTDAFFNLQETGELYYADHVTGPWQSLSGESWSPTLPVTVTLDLSSVAEAQPVTLYFDLLGFGDTSSSVQIDDVTLVGPSPQLVDDTVETDEDTPVIIDVLKNDLHVEGLIDPATVTVAGNPSNGFVAVNTVDGSITYTPAENYFGLDSFTYYVPDPGGALSDPATVTITINSVNDAPVADAGPDQTVVERTKVTLNGSGSTDVDDGIDSYLWIQTGGPTVELSDPSSATPVLTAPGVGPQGEVLTFKLTVRDKASEPDTDTVTITVSNVLVTGDIDDNGTVDLTDAILVLEVISRKDITSDDITAVTDVNGNGKIGLQEAIYILQKVSELRE